MPASRQAKTPGQERIISSPAMPASSKAKTSSHERSIYVTLQLGESGIMVEIFIGSTTRESDRWWTSFTEPKFVGNTELTRSLPSLQVNDLGPSLFSYTLFDLEGARWDLNVAAIIRYPSPTPPVLAALSEIINKFTFKHWFSIRQLQTFLLLISQPIHLLLMSHCQH